MDNARARAQHWERLMQTRLPTCALEPRHDEHAVIADSIRNRPRAFIHRQRSRLEAGMTTHGFSGRAMKLSTAVALTALLAACGGGGGNPGQCVSGSAQTCAEAKQ